MSRWSPRRELSDVDCNGKVDVSDIILLARFVAEDPDIKPLTEAGKKNANCYLDDTLNASDVTSIARFLAVLTKLPVQPS